jgi:hypothetical protein
MADDGDSERRGAEMAKRPRYITKIVDTGVVKRSGADARFGKDTRRFTKRLAALAERWGEPLAVVPLRFAMVGGDPVVRSVLLVFRDQPRRKKNEKKKNEKKKNEKKKNEKKKNEKKKNEKKKNEKKKNEKG